MRGTFISIGMLLLAGCGGGGGNAAANAGAGKAPPALDETQRRVAAMGEVERNAVLIRAIRSAHLDCQHVDSSQAAANPAGLPSYIATCDRTKRYAVTIGPNGDGAVTAVGEPGR